MEANDKQMNETPGPEGETSEQAEGMVGATVEPITETSAAETAEVPEEATISGYVKVGALTDDMMRTDHPVFRPGDTVKVHVKIVEGNKERIQVYEGVVIALKHGGIDRTFTVRKNSWGVGVERTFFLNSTKIDKIEVTRRGRVRRAKLYYLRERAGKGARITEKRQTQEP